MYIYNNEWLKFKYMFILFITLVNSYYVINIYKILLTKTIIINNNNNN